MLSSQATLVGHLTLCFCVANSGMEELRGGLRRMWLTHPRMFTYDQYGHSKAAILSKKTNGPSCRKAWRERVDAACVPKYSFHPARQPTQPAVCTEFKELPTHAARVELAWSPADVRGKLLELLAEQQVCVHPAPLVKETRGTYQLWYHCHRGGSHSTTAMCEHRSLGSVAQRRAPRPKRVGCGWRLKLVYPADQRPDVNPLNGRPLPSCKADEETATGGVTSSTAPLPAAPPSPQKNVKVFLDGCHGAHVPGDARDKAFFPVQEVRLTSAVLPTACSNHAVAQPLTTGLLPLTAMVAPAALQCCRPLTAMLVLTHCNADVHLLQRCYTELHS